MGTWLKKDRENPEHSCTKPSIDGEDVMVGDRWECDCGKVWEINSFTSLFDSGRRANWREVSNDQILT